MATLPSYLHIENLSRNNDNTVFLQYKIGKWALSDPYLPQPISFRKLYNVV